MTSRNILDSIAYNIIVGGMYFFPKIKYNLIFNGLENFKKNSGTLILSNHKREPDPMLIFPAIYYKKGLPEIDFVVRMDYFLPGFPGIQKDLPDMFGKMIFNVHLKKQMELLNCHPIRKFETTSVREILTDIKEHFGDFYIDELLTEKWSSLFYSLAPEKNKKLKISDVIKRRYNKYLKEEYGYFGGFIKDDVLREKTKNMERHIIEEQEKVFIDILNNGGIVAMFPEGKLSPDGKLRKIKAGLYGIVSQTDNLKFLHSNITYDFMHMARKINTHINIGEEKSINEKDNSSIDSFVQNEINNLTTITPSNLFSYYFVGLAAKNKKMPYVGVKTEELESRLFSAFSYLQDNTYFIDRKMLKNEFFKESLNSYLAYCSSSIMFKPYTGRIGDTIVLDTKRVLETEASPRQNPMLYCANEISHFQILKELFD